MEELTGFKSDELSGSAARTESGVQDKPDAFDNVTGDAENITAETHLSGEGVQGGGDQDASPGYVPSSRVQP